MDSLKNDVRNWLRKANYAGYYYQDRDGKAGIEVRVNKQDPMYHKNLRAEVSCLPPKVEEENAAFLTVLKPVPGSGSRAKCAQFRGSSYAKHVSSWFQPWATLWPTCHMLVPASLLESVECSTECKNSIFHCTIGCNKYKSSLASGAKPQGGCSSPLDPRLLLGSMLHIDMAWSPPEKFGSRGLVQV